MLNWNYKKIGNLPIDLLQSLQRMVVNLDYKPVPVLYNYISTERPNKTEAYVNTMHNLVTYLQKYFHIDGHRGTNIARMNPVSYVPEHNDKNLWVDESQIGIKLQIPIITSDKSGMMWSLSPDVLNESSADAVNFEEGAIYIINQYARHSVINLDKNYRYNVTSRWVSSCILDPNLIT
jgi:hypothetical protein